jgi:hypothetical protein
MVLIVERRIIGMKMNMFAVRKHSCPLVGQLTFASNKMQVIDAVRQRMLNVLAAWRVLVMQMSSMNAAGGLTIVGHGLQIAGQDSSTV